MKPYLIQHLLEDSCTRYPDKVCIGDHSRSLTYSDVVQRAGQIASALDSLKVGAGEHVGIFLDKSIEQVLSIFGILYSAGVFVIINPILKKEQISHIIKDCNISSVITSHTKIKTLAAEFTDAGIADAIVFRGQDTYGFKNEIFIDEHFNNLNPLQKDSTVITDDTSHIIYTSGSTGMPKGIVLSHRNTIDGARIVSSYTGLRPEDKMMGALPFNFDYGLNQLMNTVYMGATLYLHTFFMPNDLLRILEIEKITVFAGMVPIWVKICDPKLTDLNRQYDFPHLRILTNTGGKVPVSIIQKIRSLFPDADFFLMYGLTEAFRSTFLDPSEIERRPDSIGKAIPDVEILVLNKEGQECGPDEEGELVHRGALISKGYWNNPEKTSEVFRPNPLLGKDNCHLETVVFSGDIVKKDDDGFLYYVGRRDNMIKTKGYRVSPTEVEQLISNMDGISDCVATGFVREDEILLRVFLHLNDTSLTAEEVMLRCKKNFPFYLIPDDIEILQGFPLTANGKVDRNRIIEEYKNAKK